VRFFDASALVKRYLREPGSTSVRRLLARGDVAVSRLSEIEVTSVLARVSREGGITTGQRDRAVRAFMTDMSAWTVVELTSEVARGARELLLRHALRSGDAIQLASSLVLADSLGGIESFIAHDTRLLDAARAERLPA